jgi:hypothetical protein
MTQGDAGPSEAPAKVTEADRAFAQHARRKLDAATDMKMLLNVSDALVHNFVSRGRFDSISPFDSEPGRLGLSYLNRAIQLDPKNTAARSLQAWVASVKRSHTLNAALKGVPHEKREDVIRALPDVDRLQALSDFARRLRGEARTQASMSKLSVKLRGDAKTMAMDVDKRDAAGAKALWDHSRTVAEDVLRLADSRRDDPDRGTAIFSAHLSLGAIALHDNDLTDVLNHMEAAANAPPSDELKYGQLWDWQYLAVELLKQGERESVARFLDRLAAISEVPSGKEGLAKAAAQIRAGQMPAFYQYQTVPRSVGP